MRKSTLNAMFSLISFVYLVNTIYASEPTESDFKSLLTTNCTMRKSDSTLKCVSSLGSEECKARIDGVASNFSTFAIGELKANGGSNPLIWFRLYPRKLDNSGWWYYKDVGKSDTKLTLHSRGKKSPDHVGILVVDNICWAKMNEIIRSSKSFETIKAEKYNPGMFGLFSKPYHKVKTIGTLTVSE